MFYGEIPVNPEVELLCKILLTCDNWLNYDFVNSIKFDSENENSIHYKIYVKMMFMFLDNLFSYLLLNTARDSSCQFKSFVFIWTIHFCKFW